MKVLQMLRKSLLIFYLDIAIDTKQNEQVVRLCELLVHVTDQEDAALASTSPGILAESGLGHGLSLGSGGAPDT